MKLVKIFFTGLLISFLGTLPLGTLNISATQIAISDGTTPAIYFALGALLVEITYVRISLVAMKWVLKQKKIFKWLEWIALMVIIALALSSFLAASSSSPVDKNVLLSGGVHRFWLGIMMSAVNPVQIPFWFGWSSVLFSKNILQQRNDHFNCYILGIGTGTFMGNLVFIYGGKIIVDNLNTSQQTIHLVIGIIFLITAFIMLWRIIRKKPIDPDHQD